MRFLSATNNQYRMSTLLISFVMFESHNESKNHCKPLIESPHGRKNIDVARQFQFSSNIPLDADIFKQNPATNVGNDTRILPNITQPNE